MIDRSSGERAAYPGRGSARSLLLNNVKVSSACRWSGNSWNIRVVAMTLYVRRRPTIGFRGCSGGEAIAVTDTLPLIPRSRHYCQISRPDLNSRLARGNVVCR